MAISLIWVMMLGLLSPGIGSTSYAASDGDASPHSSVTTSINESVYKEVVVKPSADAYTLNSRADTNYGSWDLLVLKRDNNSNTNRKIYTRFALADLGIRDPQKVISVTLQVYRTDTTGTTGGVGVYPVNDNSWQELGITWNNAPANVADPLAVVTVGPATKFYDFDVTAYVKSHWQDEALSFAFLGQVHGQQITFASKEQNAAGVGKEPRLVLRTTQLPLTAIEVVNPPLKTVYYPGDKLDLAGLVVNGHYEDGSVTPLTAYSVSGFDSSAPASAQQISLTAEGRTTHFNVDVRPPSGVNIPTWPVGSTLTATGTSKTKTMLTWPQALDNEDVTGYRLFDGENLMRTLSGDTLSLSLTGLTPSTSYHFRIEAGDSEGNWTSGPSLNVVTELSPPALPQVTSIASGAFNLAAWTVGVNSDGKGVWETPSGNLALTTYASAGSDPLRNVIVHQTPLIGDFVWTGKVMVTPRSDWDDLAIVFNYVDEKNYCFVSLNKSNDDATNGIFRVVNNSLVQLKDFNIGLLKPGTAQELRIDRLGSIIRVYLDADYIGEAEESQYTTGRVGFASANDRVTLSEMNVYGTELIDLQPPSSPGQFTAEAQSSKAIRLSWTASTDDSGIKLYSVYRNGVLLGTTNLTAYVDEGLAPLSEYSYYVTATDVSNKVSESSAIVTTTTLEQDLHTFPFSHKLIDSALREPLLQYQLSLEWTSHSLRSGTALMYLTTAALYDPSYKGSDGTLIKDRILAHIRNMLVPGSKREPGASGSLDTSATSLAIQALDLASTIPAVWNELTSEEKVKINLIMQAHLVAAHWGHDDDNNFSTGIDQLGNFNKGWNPNYVEGAIASALATVRYLGGADKANEFLLSFDYDNFMSKLQAAGLSSIAWTFRQTGKSALEAAVKNEFTFRGHTLDQPFEWMKDRALIMYNKTVKAQLSSNDTVRAFVLNPEGLPNVGMMGMAQEFDSVDANGIRSDLDYVTRGWNNSILSLLEAYYYGVAASGSPDDLALIQSRYAIGSTDLIYKAVNGYSGYAKGKSLGIRDEFTADANVGYDWLKELWENVISQPSLIPLREVEPEPQGLAVAKPGTIVLSDDNGQDTGLLDGQYNVTMHMWYGDNGTLYKLYENDVLMDTQVLTDKSPNAQSAVTSINHKPNGTYKYHAELTNKFGTSKSADLTVTVKHAAPAKPVLANDNWDGDGNYNVNMNMWWGTNGTTYNLYENGVLVYSQALTAHTPNAQSAVAILTNKVKGTYEYRGELVNDAGATSSDTMIVKVSKP
ncbi:DNRLRE domain-containing protein [Paenibacillus qinlingensis]|nr:DNRLRE domain-containing protein [Paenibacillus qinlingensis]